MLEAWPSNPPTLRILQFYSQSLAFLEVGIGYNRQVANREGWQVFHYPRNGLFHELG